jgi:hypothetical protein
MFTRRIVTSVCALCLATPAAAVASPATAPPQVRGPYGVAPVTGPPSTAKAKGPYGVAPTGPRTTAVVRGPYGVTPTTGPALTAKAKGPYGVTPVTAASAPARGTSHRRAVADSASPTAWRTAAIGEAALLAALAIAALALVAGRRRGPRMAM